MKNDHLTREEQVIIKHANEICKADFMTYDYDEDNLIDDVSQAAAILLFEQLREDTEIELGTLYDMLENLKK